ncbi:MAG TPA: TobH protein, partial [Mycobacterium sp.]|nr:TobH protein [Mycobacterium sp.]
ALADALDAEALRNSAGREVFTNPAKALVERMSRRRVVLAGDCAATLALARHGSSVLLRIAHQVTAATGLADALVALRAAADSGSADPVEALFHDEQIDGPVAERLRVLALALDAEHSVVASRVASLDGIDLVGAEDVPEGPGVSTAPVGAQRAEQQLAILAVRLEMAAVYLRLVRG